MEQFIVWELFNNPSHKVFIDSISWDDAGFVIHLVCVNTEQRLQIVFKGMIDAYRYRFGNFYKASGMNKLYENGSFFKVQNSKYILAVFEETQEWINVAAYTHFCIVGQEESFDILARYEPEVKILDL